MVAGAGWTVGPCARRQTHRQVTGGNLHNKIISSDVSYVRRRDPGRMPENTAETKQLSHQRFFVQTITINDWEGGGGGRGVLQLLVVRECCREDKVQPDRRGHKYELCLEMSDMDMEKTTQASSASSGYKLEENRACLFTSWDTETATILSMQTGQISFCSFFVSLCRTGRGTCRVAVVAAFCLKIFFRQQQQIPAGMPSRRRSPSSGFAPE